VTEERHPSANEVVTPAGSGEPAGPPEPALDPAPEVEPTLEELVAAAEAKADERLDDLRRLAAEFDNYRKRAAREQEALVARAHERLVRELLPVADDLERALQAAAEHEAAEPRSGEGAPGAGDREEIDRRLIDGVRLVHRALEEVLRKEGLAEIDTDGAFDPHVHEALLAQPADGVEPGHVLQVLQKGYRLGDKVLRPARVIVAE